MEFDTEIQKCVLCENILLEYGVKAKPVFSPFTDKAEIMLVGQAPGITEYKSGLPFTGDAGKSIRKLFLDCGLAEFDKYIYQTSVTKCFPGRKKGSSVDRMPTTKEIKNCSPFLTKQISIIKPKIIVCLGMLSTKMVLSLLNENDLKDVSKLKVVDVVGQIFNHENIFILPMIHPSGAANGIRAKYKKEHAQSITNLSKEIQKITINEKS